MLAIALGAVACVPDRPAREAPSGELALSDISEQRSAPPFEPRAPGATAEPSEPETLSRGGAPGQPGLLVTRELSREGLIRAVLARNPEVAARRHALRAARSRRSQVSSLDDPEVAYSIAPLTIGSGMFGQIVQVSQRFPWPGKRSSLGESAELEADAASQDVRATELDLALEASLMFDDYYLVHRSLEVNEHHRHLLEELKAIAESRLSTGGSSLQDPLQAEVEVSRLVEQDVMLRSERDAIVSSINGLLHRDPSEPLPPPPKSVSADLEEPASEAELMRIALNERPELRGLRSKERAAESMARWARREYYPDLTLMTSYNTMADPDARFMVGISAPIPLQRGRRGGALDEADARIAEARSDAARQIDRIRVEVSVARHRVVQAIRVIKILDGRTVPVAKAQVSAARADFTPGRTPFLAVVEGEKNLRDAELSRNAAIAELGRWRAKLDRAMGRVAFSKSAGAR